MDNTRLNGILQSELQNIIDEFINNYDFNSSNRQPDTTSAPSSRDENSTYAEYMTTLYTLRDVLNGYNNNIREYQDNIQTSLQIMRSIQSDISYMLRGNSEPVDNTTQTNGRGRNRAPMQPPVRQTTAERNSLNAHTRNNVPIRNAPERSTPMQDATIRNNSNHLLSYLLYPTTTVRTNTRPNTTFLQNVVVSPTEEQINNATQVIQYYPGLNLLNNECPITLEEFVDGEQIRQIHHCKHSFKETAIQNWFRSNVRCPVCRYDIRDYVQGDASNNVTPTVPVEPIERSVTAEPTNQTRSSSTVDDLYDLFSSDIQAAVSRLLNTNDISSTTDASNNLVYRFEFPVVYNEYYDMSDNFLYSDDPELDVD